LINLGAMNISIVSLLWSLLIDYKLLYYKGFTPTELIIQSIITLTTNYHYSYYKPVVTTEPYKDNTDYEFNIVQFRNFSLDYFHSISVLTILKI